MSEGARALAHTLAEITRTGDKRPDALCAVCVRHTRPVQFQRPVVATSALELNGHNAAAAPVRSPVRARRAHAFDVRRSRARTRETHGARQVGYGCWCWCSCSRRVPRRALACTADIELKQPVAERQLVGGSSSSPVENTTVPASQPASTHAHIPLGRLCSDVKR